MKRKIVTIDEDGRLTVPANTDIWMSELEMVNLFDVIAPTVRAAIKAVYKSGVLKEYDAQKYIRYPSGNGLIVYGVEMVIALAFRIESYGAAKMREYIIRTLFTVSNPNTVNVLFSYTPRVNGSKDREFFN